MISERLKLLREKKNETQAVIASALEIDRTTYNKYESGLSTPDAKMLEKLADYYDVSVDYILGRTDAVKHIVDLPDDYTVDPAKLVVFTRATQTLPEEEMNKIREYAAMLIDKQIKKEREEKKKTHNDFTAQSRWLSLLSTEYSQIKDCDSLGLVLP